MAKSIYRVWTDIFDADTWIKVSSPEVLRADYSQAREVKAPIKRDGAWFWIGYASAPATWIDSWKNYENLKSAAQKLLEIQTNKNADLTSASSYWNEIKKDWTPFGGARDASATNVGTFTDKDFQLMSPWDQASIRQSRESAAEAHLQGLSQERKSREAIGWTALQNVSDIYGKQQQAIRDARSESDKAIENKSKLWIALSVWDYKNLGVWISDINIPWVTGKDIVEAIRGNEWARWDYNIKGWSDETWVFQYQPSTWNGYSQEYIKAHPEEFKGKSIWVLPMTPANQENVTAWKIQTWLDEWRTPAQIFSKWNTWSFTWWENKVWVNSFWVKYNAPAYVEKWLNTLLKNKGITSTLPNNYTASQLNSLAQDTWKTVTELKAMTTDALNTLANEIANDPYLKTANEKWLDIRTKYWISAKDIADILRLKAAWWTAINDYRNELIKAWVDTSALDAAVKLNEPKKVIGVSLTWE